MGELSDQITKGQCCLLCLMPFENKEDKTKPYSHGHEVVCYDCWKKMTPEERNSHIRAKVRTVV